MLYDPHTRTLLQTHTEATITEAELGKLAAAKGGQTSKGEPIDGVALVFLRQAHAEQNLALIKRYGLEVRAFGDDGVERVLTPGSRVTSATSKPDGPLVVVLREEGWPHIAATAHRRLLTGGAAIGGPWVTYGWDGPTTIARVGPDALAGRTLGDIEGEALRNLAARTPKKTRVNDHTIGMGEEYAAEMILLPKLMAGVAKEIGAELMVVGVPEEHGFLATNGKQMREVDTMLRWTRQTFDETKKRRVSPIPFLVDAQGAIVGIVATSAGAEGDDAPPAKPWWKFW